MPQVYRPGEPRWRLDLSLQVQFGNRKATCICFHYCYYHKKHAYTITLVFFIIIHLNKIEQYYGVYKHDSKKLINI